MSVFEDVLISLKFPLVIWKMENDNQIICLYSNNKINNLKKDIRLNNYLENSNISYKHMYDTILMSDDDSNEIKESGKSIMFVKISDKIFYEVHYPECQSMNIIHTISNKIRNPLTNIMGILVMLEESPLTLEQKKYLNIIKKSSYDIVSVANDIIDIVNLEKNNITLDIENTSLKNILNAAIQVISNDAKKKKLVLNYTIDDDLPEIVSVDKSRLEQIIICFLHNAIKFTKYGAITINVSTFKSNKVLDDGYYNILFKIKDTGSGIDNDQKNIIDKILGIGKLRQTKPYKNYGFGLIISNYLCKLMGGHIWYKSETDIGSIFYFNIICKGLNIDNDS